MRYFSVAGSLRERRARQIPRAFPGEGLLDVKERGEQDASRLSMFIGCQLTWRPARRFLTKVLRDLSAVGSPHRTLALPEVSAQARSDASGHLPIRFQPSRAAPPYCGAGGSDGGGPQIREGRRIGLGLPSPGFA